MHKIKTTIVIFELPVPKIKQHNFFFTKITMKHGWNTVYKVRSSFSVHEVFWFLQTQCLQIHSYTETQTHTNHGQLWQQALHSKLINCLVLSQSE